MCSWNDASTDQGNDKGAELNVEEIDKFVSQIKQYRPLVHLGGGEPFVRRDLMDIISIIKNNKLKCLITTNGFLLDERSVGELGKMKVDVLIFSLYGWGESHDKITGMRGAFERTVMNLKLLLAWRKKPTKVFVSTLMLSDNINELKMLVEGVRALGVDGVKIENLNFLTRDEVQTSLRERADANLSPSTFIRDDYFSREFVEEITKIYEDISSTYKGFVFIKPHLTKQQLADWYGGVPRRSPRCFFISHSLFVNYNGDIIPCQFFPHCTLGNIKDNNLKEVWSSRHYKDLRAMVTEKRPAVCMRCCKN